MSSEERFAIFKEVCSLMDQGRYYEAYLKLGELSDYCLWNSFKDAGSEVCGSE